MTCEEARKVLGLPLNYTPKDIRGAYAQRYQRYLNRFNYATQPSERDVASTAAGILQQAYCVLTGKRPSTHLKVSGGAAGKSDAIRRVSLAGPCPAVHATTRASHQPATRTKSASRAASSIHTSNRAKTSGGQTEWLLGALIYSAICLIALLILFKGVGCTL